jgi:hypothetical protein
MDLYIHGCCTTNFMPREHSRVMWHCSTDISGRQELVAVGEDPISNVVASDAG